MGTFFKNFGKSTTSTYCSTPNFGVSTTILNTTDISCGWCKLNIASLWVHVKSCHIPERIDPRRHYFYFLYKFLMTIGRTWLGQPFWIMIWVLNGIRLGLDLDTSSWIRKYVNLLQKTLTLAFHTPNIAWPREIELANLDCTYNCLTHNSSIFSDFSNSIPAWL